MQIEIEELEQLKESLTRKLKIRIEELERENRRLKKDILVDTLNPKNAKDEFYHTIEHCLMAYECPELVGRYYTNNQLLNHLFYFLECSKIVDDPEEKGEGVMANVDDM